MEIVVHRGANDVAPENTMAAARACAEMRVEYVEIDVWRSIDGVHYIMHDPTLNRTTNGLGPIALRTSRYIDKLDAGSWFSTRFSEERVPRLEQFLDWARDRLNVYLDVKNGDLKKIVSMIRRRDMQDRVFFWFHSDRTAARFRQLAPDIALKMNSRTPEQVREHKRLFDHQIVEHGPNDESAAVIAACRELGIRTMANITERDGFSPDEREHVYRRVFELGYDMVNLDRPSPFIEYEKKHGIDRNTQFEKDRTNE
ncbi:MAG: hypothetical protein EA426_03800 [Spirochaetaceae bacterium]|nr:MAG: hypothetical protein EA426_03800 [Spirochaetaceae bacterium]